MVPGMEDRTVYSTDPSFRQPEALRLSFRRGAKGAGMTVVEGLILHPTLKERMLSAFKKRLGCGGAVKDGALELQGDRRDFLEKEFVSQGYKVKRVGG